MVLEVIYVIRHGVSSRLSVFWHSTESTDPHVTDVGGLVSPSSTVP